MSVAPQKRFSPYYRYPDDVVSPVVFAVKFLGMKLYVWQALVLDAIGQGLPVALAAANGSGKTRYIVAPIILWTLYHWPRARIPVTSGSWTQLEQQLWPHLLEHENKFPNWSFPSMRIHTPEGGACWLFSTNDPGRAEGTHGAWPDEPVLYIIDEAKGVDNGIFVASDRCTCQFRLICSRTGGPFGRFYECFHSLSSEYFTYRVKSAECPHLAEKFERDTRIYQPDDPDFLSMHFSEFMDEDGPGLIVTQGSLRRCLDNPPAYKQAARVAFCDFAAGGDENVIALCDGNQVKLIRCWRDTDPIRACKDFIAEFERLGLIPPEIYADEGGMGIVMIKYLAERGWHVNPVNNAAKAFDDEHYGNRGSEIWFRSAKRIMEQSVILPNDAIFFKQATSRRRDYDGKMRLLAESKDSMSSHGVKSPDRADAVFGALYCRGMGAITRETLEGMYVPGMRGFPVNEQVSFEPPDNPGTRWMV